MRRSLRKAWSECHNQCKECEPWNPPPSEMTSIFQVCLSTVDDGASGIDVSEVFSMPRIVPLASQKGLEGGKSFDIANGWNFLLAEHRKQCIQDIKQHKPRVLMISPPCRMYSAWQRLNAYRGRLSEKEMVEARTLLLFGVQLCALQREMGNYYVFEHPQGATSWNDPAWEELLTDPACSDVVLDQCMFGLRDPGNYKAYKKATVLRTNCRHVQQLMGCRCDGSHEHQVLEGQVKVAGEWVPRSRVAQVYPKPFVEKILSCVKKAVREKETEVVREALIGEQTEASNRSARAADQRPSERASDQRPSERSSEGERPSEGESRKATEGERQRCAGGVSDRAGKEMESD